MTSGVPLPRRCRHCGGLRYRGHDADRETRDSAWFGTDLLLRLRNLGVEQVVMAGVSTHACIAQTARDAYANNVRATIVTDAVADEREDHKDMILEQLAGDRQAELATLAEVRERWTPLLGDEEARPACQVLQRRRRARRGRGHGLLRTARFRITANSARPANGSVSSRSSPSSRAWRSRSPACVVDAAQPASRYRPVVLADALGIEGGRQPDRERGDARSRRGPYQNVAPAVELVDPVQCGLRVRLHTIDDAVEQDVLRPEMVQHPGGRCRCWEMSRRLEPW